MYICGSPLTACRMTLVGTLACGKVKGMNVRAVNLYGSTPNIGASKYAGTAKYVPSDKERQERLSRIDEKANGGTSKDGDTVTVSAEGSKLQKMYEAGSSAKNSFLKEETPKGGSPAEAVARNSEKMGITPEVNEKNKAAADVQLITANLKASNEARTSNEAKASNDLNAEKTVKITNEVNAADDAEAAKEAKAEKNADKGDLKSFSNNELKQLFEKGDISTASYKEEMDDRSTNGVKKAEDSGTGRKEAERLEDIETKKAQDKRADATRDRLDTEKENAARNREADKELLNNGFSFKDSPYDVTSSIKEMEEDESEAGVNRIEIPERNDTGNTPVPDRKVPETTEEAGELEDISSAVNSENTTAASEGSEIIENAGLNAAQATIDENAVNNRVTVQEVA